MQRSKCIVCGSNVKRNKMTMLKGHNPSAQISSGRYWCRCLSFDALVVLKKYNLIENIIPMKPYPAA